MQKPPLRFACEFPRRPQKSLDEHCHRLGLVLSTQEFADHKWAGREFGQASSWLELAGGVRKVEITTGLFDESSMFCGTAADFETSRSRAVSDYYTELTRFLFAWGAFETIVALLKPPGWREGKVRAVARFLTGRFDVETIAHYRCAVAGLRRLVIYSESLGMSDSDFNTNDSHGESAVGIRVVYKLRNGLSHGSLKFPLDESTGKLLVVITRASTRIVLLTIQMLLVACFEGTGVRVKQDQGARIKTIELYSLLRDLHMRKQVRVF